MGQLFVGEYFLFRYAAGIGVGAVVLSEVAGAVGAVEEVVNTVPGELGTIEAVGKARGGSGLGEHGEREAIVLRGGGKVPEHDTFEVDAALGSLKVVDVGDAALFAASGGKAGDELSKLGGEGECGWCLGVDAGQPVDGFGDEGGIMAVAEVKAIDAVGSGLVAEVVFLGEGFFVEVHEGGSDVEVGFNLVVDVSASHGLGHHAEGVVLAADADGGTTAEDAFVDDADCAHGVVDGVVDIFNERNASGGDGDGAGGDTVAKRYFTADGGGEIALDVEFVFVGILLGEGAGHGVQRVEAVLRGKLIVVDNLTQVAPEGFDIGEEDAACAGLDDTALEGSTVEPVEDTIGIVVVL